MTNEKKTILLSTSFLACVSLVLYLSVFYEDFSRGFASDVNGSVFYCRELQTSGSDDDAIMISLLLLVVPLLIRLFNVLNKVKYWEAVVFVLFSAISLAIVIIGLECGEFFFTAIEVPDMTLITIVVLQLFAFLTLWWNRQINS